MQRSSLAGGLSEVKHFLRLVYKGTGAQAPRMAHDCFTFLVRWCDGGTNSCKRLF